MKAFFNEAAVGSVRRQIAEGVIRRTSAKRHTQLLHPFFTQSEEGGAAQFKGAVKERVSLAETVRRLTREVIPRVQSSIERRLLLKAGLDTLEHAQLERAYLSRKEAFEAARGLDPSTKAEPKTQMDPSGDVLYSNINGSGLKFHTHRDVGSYTVFPGRIMETLFPGGQVFGDYDHELSYTGSYGIMCREEGLKLAHDFSHIRTRSEREIDYMGLLRSGIPLKEIAEDEEVYLCLYQDLADDLKDMLAAHPDDRLLKQLFSNAGLFDGFVGMLIRNLRARPLGYHLLHPGTRPALVRQFVNMVVTQLRQINERPKDFQQLIGHIGEVTLRLDHRQLVGLEPLVERIRDAKARNLKAKGHSEADYSQEQPYAPYAVLGLPTPSDQSESATWDELTSVSNFQLRMRDAQQFNQTHWRPRALRWGDGFKGFNTGALLWGDRGAGKSQILTYLACWARESDWMVIPITHGREFVSGEEVLRHHQSGLYVQPQTARKLLLQIRSINYELLKSLPVDLSLYGNCDMSGQPAGEGVPRRYIHERRVYSDAWKVEVIPEERVFQEAQAEWMKDKWLVLDVPEPKNLLEIVEGGIRDMYMATSAIGELMKQLSACQEAKTMILLDQYSHWFKPSAFQSFRYLDVPRARRGRIPPHDMAIPRLLMNFDGQLLRNGVKVGATSIGSGWFKHEVTPAMINFPAKGFDIKVSALALDDFRNAVNYLLARGFPIDPMDESKLQIAYQDTQGNWAQLFNNYTMGQLNPYF